MNTTSENKIPLDLKKIFLPLAIGIGVSVYLIATNFHVQSLQQIQFTQQLALGLLLAAFTVVIRDAAYVYRIREITGRKLNWRASFETIMLWEYGSAITPGAVGGIALAFFILKKEGVSFGRSTATVMLVTFLDNLAFVMVFALIFFIVGGKLFLVSAACPDLENHTIMLGLRNLADKSWIGFALFALSCAFFFVSLFLIPHTTKKFFHRVSNFRLLSRFKNGIEHLGDEIEITSHEFKQQSFLFYLKIFFATAVSWMSRYALANALLFAFAAVDLDMLQVFARQYVLWVFLVIPSTPGASGLAEVSFIAMNCEFIPAGLSTAVALIWRMYSYYLYLVIGTLVLRGWLKRVNQ